MDAVFAWLADLPDGWKIFIGILALFAIIWTPLPKLIYLVLRWPMCKLWPKREGWSADCNERRNAFDPNNAWSGGFANKWSHQKRMLKNDFFILDIFKPRVIERVKIETEGQRYPLKYDLSVRKGKNGGWESMGEYKNLDVKLPEPIKIRAIKWTITVPREDIWPTTNQYIAWAIYDIQLTEVRLISKWWRKIIEER